MRIAVTYGPMCLQRSPEETWNDPRTGSEIGWVRIVQGLRDLGHVVGTYANDDMRASGCDVAIAVNEPDQLRLYPRTKLRICMFWLNEFSFCKEGFDEHVDYYLSPSEAHRQKAIGEWGARSPEKWGVNYLGCDVLQGDERRDAGRVPGRAVYCSSPDRGLHRVLEAWPRIKRAAPHATLRVFYRLQPWVDELKDTPYFPPIERNRTRALYIEEALNRLCKGDWGVTVHDSITRDELQRELAQAEVFLHPCDTLSWSEGFSCSTMEACAAGAAPIISDCDALGEVYAPLEPVRTGDWAAWRDRVIRALNDAEFRQDLSRRAVALAQEHTWKAHVSRLDQFLRAHS